MKRYSTKKWWTMAESDLGGYVSYDEANEMIERLRNERDRLRVDNDNVWQRVAQQSNEYSELENRYKILQKMFWDLDTAHKHLLLEDENLEGDYEKLWHERRQLSLNFNKMYKERIMYQNRFKTKHQPLDWGALVRSIKSHGWTNKAIEEATGISASRIQRLVSDSAEDSANLDKIYALLDLYVMTNEDQKLPLLCPKR